MMVNVLLATNNPWRTPFELVDTVAVKKKLRLSLQHFVEHMDADARLLSRRCKTAVVLVMK